jgi:hypothetical protein
LRLLAGEVYGDEVWRGRGALGKAMLRKSKSFAEMLEGLEKTPEWEKYRAEYAPVEEKLLADLDQQAKLEPAALGDGVDEAGAEDIFDVDYLPRAQLPDHKPPRVDIAATLRDGDGVMDDQAESWRRLKQSFTDCITGGNESLVAHYESSGDTWRFEGSPESERVFKALAREAGFRLTDETGLDTIKHGLDALRRNQVAPVGPDSTTDPSTDGTLSR